MFQKIARYLVYAIVFLVPLFNLPFTADVLDFQKQFLLLLLLLLAVFFWVGGMVGEKKITIKYTPSYILVGVFLAIVFFCSLFSQYEYGSFWGSLSVADSFATALGMGLLYLLVTNLFERKQTQDLLFVAVFSGGVAALYAFLQSFGLYLIPFGYAKNASFNTVGSVGSLVFALVILFCAVLPLLFSVKGSRKWILITCEAIFALDIILFNVVLAWVVLALGSLAAFLFLMSSDEFAKKYRSGRAVLFSLMALAIVFATVNFLAGDILSGAYQATYKQIGAQAQPNEVYLSQSASGRIAYNAMRQTAKSLFLGTGPGTFIYDFARFKPAAISQNDYFWNVEFTSGSSEAINFAATKGILGLLAILALMGFVSYKGFKMLTEEKDGTEIALALFSGWLAVISAFFLYSFNFTLVFLLWLFVALWGAAGLSKSKSVQLRSIKLTYFVSLAMIMLLVVEIGLAVWCAKRYYAEVKYLQTAKDLQKNDLDAATKDLEASVLATQSLQDNYLTDLAQVYLAKSNQISSQMSQQKAQAKDIGASMAPYISGAVQAAQLATDSVNPNNVVNWSVRGSIMLQLASIGVPGDPASWAQKSFDRALKLEPSNPVLWTQQGQVFLVNNDLNGAKTDFQKAVDLNPKYSNARYYLGLIEDQQGNKQAAIDEFMLISQLNPDDETIAKILQNLQTGKPALGEAPVPSAPQPSLQEEQPIPGALPVSSGDQGSSASAQESAASAAEPAAADEPQAPSKPNK